MSIEYGVRECDSHLDLAKGVRFIHTARLYHVRRSSAGAFQGHIFARALGTSNQ